MPSEKRQRQRENSRARQEAAIAAQKQSQQRTRILLVGGIALVLIVAVVWAMQGGDDKKDTKVAADKTTTTVKASSSTTAAGGDAGDPNTCPPAAGTATRHTTFSAAPKMCIDVNKKYSALVKTDAGDFTIEFNPKQAPKTVNNFVFLARNKYFDGIIFHRVIPDFVIQGGDPQGTGTGGPGYKFDDEIPDGYKYSEADIAMANSGANTNGSQFFIVTSAKGAQTLLDAVGGTAKYSPFGKVTKGFEVVKKIEADGSASGTPTVTHKMLSVTITEE